MNDMDGINYEKMNIQWFPGHMTKAQRMIEDSIKQVDAVCEILDARIPNSSRNPDIDRLAAGKPRLIILNRTDLADPNITAQWRTFFEEQGIKILETDAKSGKGVSGFAPALRELLKDKIADYAAKGQINRPMRVMILGIPRGKQWINIDKGLDLLDTPGILWPKFDSQEVGEMLAITNAIKADVLDKETLAANFMLRLREMYPEALTARYKFEPDPEANGFELLEEAAKYRAFLITRR